MVKSVAESSQFRMLSPSQRDLIMQDIASTGNPMPTINMQVAGVPVAGPVFKDDADSYQGVTGPLTTTDIAAPAMQPTQPQQGALSRVPVQRQEPDIAAMLEKYMPQDDSQSKYLALAAGFGSATKTGSFSEQLGNVASAMNEQKMSQAKLRSQYVPLIMQQVAAQQAREEQNAYRLEAQQQAQAAQAAAQQREQQFKAEQNAQAQQEARTRAEAERATREQIAADRLAALQEGRRVADKPPAGYAYGPPDAKGQPTMFAVSGGPADIKAQAQAQQKLLGASDVDSAIATLRDAYSRLEKGGGITSTEASGTSNMGAAVSSSGLGQTLGRALGTDNQSARNDIAMTRPMLLAALMKSTGMSAKQMDSNAELKLWLATATDPTLDVQSNRRALDAIERKYLHNSEPQVSTPAAPMLPAADAIAAEKARRAALKGK